MKITLLLIPLLFLSSCTIDWNDEKNTKIVELEKQIMEWRTTKKDINPNNTVNATLCRNKIHIAEFSPIYEQSGSLYFFDWTGMLANSFKRYDCITNIEFELLSANMFYEISKNLPVKNQNYRVGLYLDEAWSTFTINNDLLSFSYFPPCAEQCWDSDTSPYYFISIDLRTKNVSIARERQYIKQFQFSSFQSTIDTLSGKLSEKITSADLTTKNFWSGFTLSQTDDETSLSYSEKVVKTWSHTPPKEVPFIWDEACALVWKWFEKLAPNEQSTWKQWVWDALMEEERKECMKEDLGSVLYVKQYDNRFFEIIKPQYGSADIWLYDIISGNIQKIDMGEIESINSTQSKIIIKIKLIYGDIPDKIFIYTSDFSKLIKE